jgi:hypothetical protein
MKKFLFIVAIVVVLMSCSERKKADLSSRNDNFKIELINCDGETTKSWESVGRVGSGERKSGYQFLDKATGKLIEIDGTIVITQL